jgi:Holliday junction resolvase RusA-like endonuclease
MHFINIKPLSLNNAYATFKGHRIPSRELKQFKCDMAYLLPNIVVPEGKLMITYLFGVSSKSVDADNLSKSATDSLAMRYNFNDNKVYKFILEKTDVKKGDEFIGFLISEYKG